MAGRIPQQFIDEVLARTDIVSLIDSRVPLKKAGKDYVARCPFHDEKTPSFTVSPDKQFYHCFGCGAHGSAIGFLMEYDHLEFREAVEELARQAGLSLPQPTQPHRPAPQQGGHDIPALHRILERAAHYYQAMLRRHPERDRAVTYLKGRGVSGEIAKRFELGYAPPGWHNLEDALGHDPDTRAHLLEAGLLTRREDDRPPYDRFRDRIMFPIRDLRGRVVGFGGRLIDGDGPKYLNSPETPVFHKGEELYGLYQARRAGELRRLLVVEGYMDVVALAQHGIHYAVATLGTALTPEHLRRAYRLVDEIVFCFDGDTAGEAAAWRAVETLLPFLDDRRSARFVFLPQGRDPDDHVRAVGKAAFEAEIERSVTFSDFFLDRLGREADLRSMDGHARLIQQARPLLARACALAGCTLPARRDPGAFVVTAPSPYSCKSLASPNSPEIHGDSRNWTSPAPVSCKRSWRPSKTNRTSPWRSSSSAGETAPRRSNWHESSKGSPLWPSRPWRMNSATPWNGSTPGLSNVALNASCKNPDVKGSPRQRNGTCKTCCDGNTPRTGKRVTGRLYFNAGFPYNCQLFPRAQV